MFEPADFARALVADPIARAAYDRLPDGRKREHVRAIESAKKPDTRKRRIEKATATLRDLEPGGSAAGREDRERMIDGDRVPTYSAGAPNRAAARRSTSSGATSSSRCATPQRCPKGR